MFTPLLNRLQRYASRLRFVISFVLMAQLLMMPAWAESIYEMPQSPPEHPVLDQSEILSRVTEGTINRQLEDLRQQQQQQEVYFVTVRRLDYDETIDSFAQKLFQRWFTTPEAQANATLLVIDTLTDNTGIATGESAKQRLSDAIARSVAQETVLVPLKYGNRYNQAFLDASDRITAVLSGQPDPGAPTISETVQAESTFATPEETQESNATVWVIVLLVLATVIPMATYYLYLYVANR
jgi:uncharacterized protein